METRLPTWRALAPTAAFVMTCLVATLLLWKAFGGATPLQARGYRVQVPLDTAPTLFTGSDVRISGITVGKVVAVRRSGAHAKAELDIEPRYAPLRRGTRALLRSKTLLGEGYLTLAPGPATAPAIRDGGSLDRADVMPAQRLDDVIATFDVSTRRRLRSFLAGLAKAWRGAGADVNNALGAFEPAAGGLERTLRVLDEQGASLRALIRNGGVVAAALGRRQGAMRTAIRSGQRVFEVTARQERGLAQTLRALPPFLVQLQRTARVLEAADADLRPAAAALASAAPALEPALRQTMRTAPEARRMFAEIRSSAPRIAAALPGAARVLRAAAPSLDEVHPVLRELQPVLELLTTVRDAAVTTFAGVGQIHNGTFIAEDNRVQHYANGIITVWNESIGGWVKRLPSNRGNTYPKPGFLHNIATGLASFDCRHLRNPAYLPPFGGTPPCKTQGPWTYDGQTRYYPTLQPAPP